MRQIVQDLKTGRIVVIEGPRPVPGRQEVSVRTLFSVISPGTERASVRLGKKSLLSKAIARPDLVRQVVETISREGIVGAIRKVRARLDEYRAMGYCSVGVVERVGSEVRGLLVGDMVACGGGGYAVHAEIVCVPQNLCARVPRGVAPDDAAFATMGAIALQGLRRAGLVLGESVAVLGLGLIGQLTTQLARAAGCRVLALDPLEARVSLARELGAIEGAVLGRDNLQAATDRLTNGLGVDAVLITASSVSSEPIELAGRIARDRATVVVVGDIRMNVPRQPFYDKELELKLSRSYGPGRYDANYEEKGLDYPIGYVRWTEQRNMEAFLGLLADRSIDLTQVKTHRFPLDRARDAYELLLNGRGGLALGILIEYPNAEKARAEVPSSSEGRVDGVQAAQRRGRIGLGVIGAGKFAQAYLLPHLKRDAGVELRAVVTARSVSARQVATRFGFGYCATDPQVILSDPAIDAVVIATRHDLHERLVIDAISAGKSVFVEKPLALSETGLDDVVRAYTEARQRGMEPRVMVGFNRRFAPLVREFRDGWGPKRGPWVVAYRVNAGPIPLGHWLRDLEQGGGRILGEVCHFVDLCHFLVGHPPSSVRAEAVSSGWGAPVDDNLVVTIRFDDGSLATITYVAAGPIGIPKERIEVLGEGKGAVIDDFRVVDLMDGNRRRRRRAWRADKGHRDEMVAFVRTVRWDTAAPVPFADLVLSTLTTLKIAEALREGTLVKIVRPTDLQRTAR